MRRPLLPSDPEVQLDSVHDRPVGREHNVGTSNRFGGQDTHKCGQPESSVYRYDLKVVNE